jgi:hypothetical protein
LSGFRALEIFTPFADHPSGEIATSSFPLQHVVRFKDRHRLVRHRA